MGSLIVKAEGWTMGGWVGRWRTKLLPSPERSLGLLGICCGRVDKLSDWYMGVRRQE